LYNVTKIRHGLKGVKEGRGGSIVIVGYWRIKNQGIVHVVSHSSLGISSFEKKDALPKIIFVIGKITW